MGKQKPDNESPKENGTASWSKKQRTKPVAWSLNEEWLWEAGCWCDHALSDLCAW